VAARAVRDEFDAPRLAVQWVHLRTSASGLWSLTERPGALRLKGSARTLEEVATPAFVGRRRSTSAPASRPSSNSIPRPRVSTPVSCCGRTRTITTCCESPARHRVVSSS
jgi:hypothetical protein